MWAGVGKPQERVQYSRIGNTGVLNPPLGLKSVKKRRGKGARKLQWKAPEKSCDLKSRNPPDHAISQERSKCAGLILPLSHPLSVCPMAKYTQKP